MNTHNSIHARTLATTVFVAVLVAYMLAVTPAYAARYIKIGSIEGESTNSAKVQTYRGVTGDTFAFFDVSGKIWDSRSEIWRQVSGPFKFETREGGLTSIVPQVPGTYVFELVATDSSGALSATRKVEVVVEKTDATRASDPIPGTDVIVQNKSTDADDDNDGDGDATVRKDTQQGTHGSSQSTGHRTAGDPIPGLDVKKVTEGAPIHGADGKWKVYSPLPGITIDEAGTGKSEVKGEVGSDAQGRRLRDAPPANLRVSAVEVRGWDDKTKEAVRARLAANVSYVNAEDFGMFVAVQALENPTIVDITVNEEGVRIAHDTTLSLFGFIPVKARSRVVYEGTGILRQSHPWWSFLARKSDDSAIIETAKNISAWGTVNDVGSSL